MKDKINASGSNRFSPLNKILVLLLILITSLTSMSFRGCTVTGLGSLYNSLLNYLSCGAIAIEDIPGETKYSIYVGENGVILRSTGDTNIVFEQKTSGTTQRLNFVRVSSSTSNGFVFAVGNNGTIARSTNTGNNWSVSAPVSSANLYGADFRSGGYCYAVGDSGAFLVSATGGDTWGLQPCGTSRNLKAIGISALSALNVVAVGEKGTIIRSTNSGINWTNSSVSDTTVTFNDITKRGIYYNTGSNFCIVGSGGRIYKSTDNGATWQQKPSGTTNTLRSIYQHTTDSIVVVGDNGTIRFSSNGGESWYTDAFFNSLPSRQYKAVSLVNIDRKTFSALSDSIWFVSNDPVTLGITPVSSEIPRSFSLSQNYPNPFNPSTNIEFSISELSQVKLVVYDINGREVDTLVSGNLNAGVYRADWNASRYSSGVYFYKLMADNFAEAKRMVLVK